MFGAILGDIIGSPYEFDRGNKNKDFLLFSDESTYTDDSVMTLAVAAAFLDGLPTATDEWTRNRLVSLMQYYGKQHPYAGYGGRFSSWLRKRHPKPYNSFGNGSAMRVSSVAWLYDTIDAVRHAAHLSAEVTHNHPEGIKGAESTASAIFLARTGHSKAEIKAYIEREFAYDLSRTCDEIRPQYHHVESCMETVPEAITAFLEGTSFEDVIRTAVSLGGDCDTLTAIAGSIAEGFYGVPDELKEECRKRLPEDLRCVLMRYEEYLAANTITAEAYHIDRDENGKLIIIYHATGEVVVVEDVLGDQNQGDCTAMAAAAYNEETGTWYTPEELKQQKAAREALEYGPDGVDRFSCNGYGLTLDGKKVEPVKDTD